MHVHLKLRWLSLAATPKCQPTVLAGTARTRVFTARESHLARAAAPAGTPSLLLLLLLLLPLFNLTATS
jgi:hypothetical protein